LTLWPSQKRHFTAPIVYTLQNYASEIVKLKEVIESLIESITQLKVASEKLKTSQNQTTSKASMSQPPIESQARISKPHKKTTSDRKFNNVMHGVKESVSNTIRPGRLDHDLTNITQAFSETQVPLKQNSIKDCHRFEKFRESANIPTPILITFLHSGDASLALLKISSL